MDKMESEKAEVKYQAPVVEVIQVQVEKGFATSDMEPYTSPNGNGGWS